MSGEQGERRRAGGSGEVTPDAPARVAVVGAAGRMGSTVCEALVGDARAELVAGVDRDTGAPAGPASLRGAVPMLGSLDELDPSLVDVIVDFSVAEVALASARWCAANGVHLVCGTTGLGDDGLGELAALFGEARGAGDGRANCVLAANFSISAVLMARLAELAAVHFDSIEIVELHHDDKLDAPSGTALETARRIAAAREAAGSPALRPDPTTDETLPGARGGAGPGGIHLHAVRLHGLVAHQEVLLGAAGQSLTIRQDSYDRTSFMPGVLLAVHEVASTPGLTVGIESLLGSGL